MSNQKPKGKRGRPRKIDQVKQTSGKVEKATPSTLDQIFGEVRFGSYKTIDVNEYSNYLDSLSKTDLQGEALSKSLLPDDNPSKLKQALIREFRRHMAENLSKDNLKASIDKRSEVEKILSEGK